MTWVEAGLVSIVIIVGAVVIRVRTLDVPAQRYHLIGGPQVPGDHPDRNGFTAVRAVADPAAALIALAGAAAATPRTTRLDGSVARGHVSYVTRSRVFRFPDVTNLWIADGHVHARGQAVLGKGDMGVNRRRVTAWLRRAGIT